MIKKQEVIEIISMNLEKLGGHLIIQKQRLETSISYCYVMKINRLMLMMLFLLSMDTLAQGEYLYVNASDAGKYGVSLVIEKEKYYNRWCIDIKFPEKTSHLKEGVFTEINYLLKRKYEEMEKDQAPAMYLSLAASKADGDDGFMKTDFCLAKEYYKGAEILIKYDNGKKSYDYDNVVVWVQNIEFLIKEKSHNKSLQPTLNLTR